MSPYKACSNSLSEIQNKSIIRHLRAFCKQPQQFHEFLPAISAGINCTVNTALGTTRILCFLAKNIVHLFALHYLTMNSHFEICHTQKD
jgi:hypothetical protein